MKLTKTKLKTIIKEEIRKVVEGFKKQGEEGIFVDLFEFTNLVTGGENEATVTGIDTSMGVKAPMNLTLTRSDEPPVRTLKFSDKVYVPTELFGQPVEVPQVPGSFIVNF